MGLSVLLGLLLWSIGFGIYLNRIRSRGWDSTRRLLRTLPPAGTVLLLLCGLFWESGLAPRWLLAHAGWPAAQMDLAGRYMVGDRVLARNQAKARAWITRAARSGSAEARLALAGMDLEGQGRSGADPGSALASARMAAAQGLMDAQLLAGEILARYPQLAQPGERAQTYFDAALPQVRAQAAAGSAHAMFSLGLLKINGRGLPFDPEGGFALLLAAQAKGISVQQAFRISVLRSKLPPPVVLRAEAAWRQGIPTSR
jgi:TPR repeat protein